MKFHNIILVIATFSTASLAATNQCSVQRTISSARYSILQNGAEVLDKQTQLVWRRCLIGQYWSGNECANDAINMVWESALLAAKQAGGSWRLPNAKESMTLAEYACQPIMMHPIFVEAKGVTTEGYWTSTPDIIYPQNAFMARLTSDYYGGLYTAPTNYLLAVRLVRPMQ